MACSYRKTPAALESLFNSEYCKNFSEHLFWRTLANNCFWKWAYIKKTVFSTSILEASEDVCFYFMIGFLWSLCWFTCNISLNLFLWHGDKWTLNTKYLLQLIKRRSKVQKTNISCELALNLDQWKLFSEKL